MCKNGEKRKFLKKSDNSKTILYFFANKCNTIENGYIFGILTETIKKEMITMDKELLEELVEDLVIDENNPMQQEEGQQEEVREDDE